MTQPLSLTEDQYRAKFELTAEFVQLVMKGWEVVRVREGSLLGKPGEVDFFYNDKGEFRMLGWNPFESVEDDYEVLEHLRGRLRSSELDEYAMHVCRQLRIRSGTDFTTHLTISLLLQHYKPGTYARAAETFLKENPIQSRLAALTEGEKTL